MDPSLPEQVRWQWAVWRKFWRAGAGEGGFLFVLGYYALFCSLRDTLFLSLDLSQQNSWCESEETHRPPSGLLGGKYNNVFLTSHWPSGCCLPSRLLCSIGGSARYGLAGIGLDSRMEKPVSHNPHQP